MEKITFVAPVYNKEAWIAESIESLQAQTLKEIGILFVDDGSTDGTKDIIKHYMKGDKRIKLLSLRKNVGLGKAWNLGQKACGSDIICVASGDDIWTANRAEITYKFFKSNPTKQVFYGAFWNVDSNLVNIEFKPAVPFSKKLLLTPREDGFSTQYIGHFVMAYRKNIAKKYPYDEKRKYGIDYPFVIDLAKNDVPFGWTKEVLGYARRLESGVSHEHRKEIVRQDKEMENKEMRK